jgi:hypothetical protein
MPKYPAITVQLSGEDGNVFAIIGRVSNALKRGGAKDVSEFQKLAMGSESYDAVLQLCMEWVEVE